MSNGYNGTDNYAKPQSSTGVVTNLVVSKPFPVTAGGSRNMAIKLVFSGVTVAGAITAKLQTALNDDWVDSKTVTVSATGNFYIKLLEAASADQTYLPLLSSGRIVITTTNAGDIFTISSVQVLQEL